MDASVRRIVVDIVTSYATGASTKAPVMLGLGGREFRLHVDEDDFERGNEMSFQLGEDANVEHAIRNDPRTGTLVSVKDVLSNVVYLRLIPKSDKDDWCIANVNVRVFPQAERRAIRFAALEKPNEVVWLGLQCGTILTLKRGSLARLATAHATNRK